MIERQATMLAFLDNFKLLGVIFSASFLSSFF